MAGLVTDLIHVHASIDAPGVKVRLVQYRVAEPCDAMLKCDTFRLELALSSRPASTRGNYPAHWPDGRFERIGEMFIVAPGRDLRVKMDAAPPIDAVVCELDRDLFLDLYVEHLGPQSSYPFREGDPERYLAASLDVQNARIRTLLGRLAEEARHPGIAASVLVSAMAIQVAIELLRVGASVGAPKTHGGLAPWQLRLIDERLKQVGTAPSLPELAGLCHISVRHLTRAFKESRGYTIGSFVTTRHMDHAKKLLADGATVASVASHLGFATSSGFCSAFSRETGFTPAEFRLKFLNPAP